MPVNLFAYGTLEFPELMEALTGHRFPSVEATLDGHARFVVRGERYPGLCVAPHQTTHGRVYLDVDAGSVQLLDRFEGNLYERRRVRVMGESGTRLAAIAYVVPDELTIHLSSEPWDRERFRAESYREFLAICRRFHALETGVRTPGGRT